MFLLGTLPRGADATRAKAATLLTARSSYTRVRLSRLCCRGRASHLIAQITASLLAVLQSCPGRLVGAECMHTALQGRTLSLSLDISPAVTELRATDRQLEWQHLEGWTPGGRGAAVASGRSGCADRRHQSSHTLCIWKARLCPQRPRTVPSPALTTLFSLLTEQNLGICETHNQDRTVC